MPLPKDDRDRRRRIAQTPELSTIEAQIQTKVEDLLDDREVNNGDEEPPFAIAEMIVMAFVMSGKETLTMREVVSEFLKAFPYYGRMTIDEYTRACFNRDPSCIFEYPVLGLYEGFNQSEAPLYTATNTAVITSKTVFQEDCLIKSPIAEANIYLRKLLKNYECPRTDGQSIELFDLPPEIRSMIYEQVFGQDRPELLVRPQGFKQLRRTHDEQILPTDDTTLAKVSVQEMMALVSVNRQCYKEALPLFYSSICFVFETPYEFMKYVKGTTSERVQMLRNVSIVYNSPFKALTGYALGARALAALTNLRKLELNITDTMWFDRDRGGAHTFSEPSQLPGISDIAYALNYAGSFKILGNCSLVRSYLMTEVARLKTAFKTREVERLRRAERLRQAKSFKEIEPTNKQKRFTNDKVNAAAANGYGVSTLDAYGWNSAGHMFQGNYGTNGYSIANRTNWNKIDNTTKPSLFGNATGMTLRSWTRFSNVGEMGNDSTKGNDQTARKRSGGGD